jgi:DNA replication protein DnaD
MDRGYVKLWRKSLDSGIMRNHKLWFFWCWCLMKATHKPIKQVVGFNLVELEPGQFVFGLNQASIETGISVQTIRTILKNLKNTENLTLKSTNKYSIVTIINWNTYQDDSHQTNNQINNQLTSNQQATNNKQTQKHRNTKTNNLSASVVTEPDSPTNGSAPKPEPEPTDEDYLSRYSQEERETINLVFEALAVTRKSGKLSPGIRTAELKYWNQFEVWKVITGIKAYMDGGYHLDGKKEQYLRGIIRNATKKDLEKHRAKTGGSMKIDEDPYWANVKRL